MKALKNVKSIAQTTKEAVAENVNDMMKNSKKRAGHLYADAQSTVSKAEKKVANYSRNVSKKIQKNPTPVILAVIGIGFLVASFFNKK